MYFKIACPQCSKSLKVRDEQSGQKCRCPYCKSSFIVPTLAAAANVPPPPSDEGEQLQIDTGETPPSWSADEVQSQVVIQKRGSQKRKSTAQREQVEAPAAPTRQAVDHSSDGSDVSLISTGLIGLAATVLLFAALYPAWTAGYRVGGLFWNSVGINFPTTLLMFWSFAILYMKSRQLNRQMSAMLMDLLPTEISQQISLSSLDKFLQHIKSLPAEARDSILVTRVVRGIEHFRVRKSAAETVTMMESQSAIDAANVAGSYTIVKVFIWAMPILGFIGTVMGVSSAVAGLSATLENAADVSQVTSSMKSVFGGLGTAFDTTLLALIMSMCVKIPTSAIQKSEDGLITVVDEYCNENLLRRLDDGRSTKGAETGADARVFREAVEAAMGTYHAELEAWLKRLDSIGARITTQVAQGWAEINAKMTRQQEVQLAAYHRQYAEHTHELQEQLQEMNRSAVGIKQAMEQISAHSAAAMGGVSDSVTKSSEVIESHFAGIERGLTGLNEVLESLGEHQVVVQQVEPAKRSWFGWKRNNGK